MAARHINEVLLKNYVIKELQHFLYPINCLQSLFFLSKYTIKYNFITPNKLFYHIISFGFICLIVSVHYYQFENILIDGALKTTVLHQSVLVNTICQIILFYVNFYVNLVNVNDNISAVLRIQEAYNTFKDLRDSVFKNLITWNWVYTIGVVLLYASANALYFVYTYLNFHFVLLCVTVSHIYLDVTLLYGIRFMQLILVGIQVWMEQVEKFAQDNLISKDMNVWKTMERSYLSILKAFEHFKAIYRVLVLFKSTGFFIRALLYLQIIMEILNLETENRTVYLGTISKIAMFSNEVKDFGLLCHICVECEIFYLRIKDVSTLASVIRNRERCPEGLKQLCKNVTRLNNMFTRMTACSVFTVDAAFPLRLLAVVTTYALVLLQFNTSNILIHICLNNPSKHVNCYKSLL